MFNLIYQIVTNWFTECAPGYLGSDCGTPCRYPNYGHFCQNECQCDEELCSFDYGCPGITVFTYHLNSFTIKKIYRAKT